MQLFALTGYSEKDVNAYKYGEENEANTMNL